MNANERKTAWSWPLAFFILNAAAIAAWFVLHGVGGNTELAVATMTPSGDSVKPERVSEVRLDFNLELDPGSVGPDTLRLVPAVAGKTERIGPSSLRFVPRESLRPATAYTVVLSPALRGSRGEAPPRELLEFATRRFTLESAAQTGYDKYSYTVELIFNQPIAASDLEKALQVRSSLGGGREVASEKYKVLGNANDRRQRVRISETTPSYLCMTLPAGLSGATGPLGLEREESILWRIAAPEGFDYGKKPAWAEGLAEKELKPEVAFLGMRNEWEDGAGVVRVHTTSQLDLSRAKDYVSVSPELPVTFASTWNGFKIMGDFQPGKQYRVTIKAGMPSSYSGAIAKDITRQVWFDDLPESMAYSYGGGFLSPEGLLTVPVKTRNINAFTLGARRLYGSNIVEYLLRDYDDMPEMYAEPQVTRKYTVAAARNSESETLIQLRDLLGEKPLGVYGLEIWRDESRWSSRDALVAVSDLGLSTRLGRGQMLAWTTSIRSGSPRSGVKVSVYSNKRQLLAEAASDSDGVAILALPPLPEGEKPALVLGEAGAGEYSFVQLDRNLRSRPAAAQRGHDYPARYDVFLSVDRGVYRGGETVRLAGLVRDATVETVPDLPLELRLLGPDGRELRVIPVKADAKGRLETEARLGESYPGGLYQLEARLPGQNDILGQTMFRMADYIPETLSVAMELKSKPEGADEGKPDNSLIIRVSRLAGGRIGGIPVNVIATYAPEAFQPEKWRDWTFGDSTRGGRSERRERNVELAADGTAGAEWNNPALDYPAAVRMTVRAEASESGGRSSSATLDATLHQTPFYIGVHAENRVAKAGMDHRLDLAKVAPDESLDQTPGRWRADLSRIEYDGVMRRAGDGRLIYEWVKREIHEATLSGEWSGGLAEARPRPVAGGQYRLVVKADAGRNCVYEFHASGEGAAWHGEDPETLTVTLDKERYAVGDTAVVATAAPFAGAALVTVETDRVLEHRIIDIDAGDNSFEIPVDDRMRPNAYIGVTLLRPATAAEEWRPHRLSGTGILRVDNGDRRLHVDLATPASLAPGKSAEIAVTVENGGEAVAGASVTLWAVDMGVLSLTNYRVPSPWERFYRLRRVGVREADMFSRLAPELSEWLASREAAPGGGGDNSELGRRLNPIFASRVKAAVLFDATLTTGDDGVARAEMTMPEFAGRMKFMCWAASGSAMGEAEKEIEITAPVSLTAAWPRFAAPGDVFEVPVRVLNRSGRPGEVKVVCEANEFLAFDQTAMTVEVPADQTGSVVLRATAVKAGLAVATVTASMGDDSFRERVEMSVRPPVMFARESGSLLVPPGGKRVLIAAPGLLAENSRVKILAGGSPMLGLSGSLEYLLDYPYGCAEQTASRLLALTYLPDLLALSRPGQIESGEVERLATACAERLLSMQNANGSLRMWPSAGDGLFWVSAQALFVLAESRSAGYRLPPNLVDDLARYLDSRIEGMFDSDMLSRDGGEAVTLACLGLAKAERVKRSWLLRLQEIAVTRIAPAGPLSSAALAHLCEAVALAGDRDSALELYRKYNPQGETPGIARHPATETAAWLMAAMSAGAPEEDQARLASELSELAKSAFDRYSTTENSMVVAALGRYWRKAGVPPDGEALARIAEEESVFSVRRGLSRDALAAGTRVEWENRGEGSLRVFWLAEGVPLSGQSREEDKGIRARRRIFDSRGNEIIAPFTLERGEVYEMRLSVSGRADDLVLADLLPAGLEIEDATVKGRVLSGPAAKNLSVKHVERKDDRLLVFASLDGDGEYRYLVRAVTGGVFAWPALDASRMYDASVRSVNGRGELRVGGGKDVANDR